MNQFSIYDFILFWAILLLLSGCIIDEIPEGEIAEITRTEEVSELSKCDSVADFISYCDSLKKAGIVDDYKFPIVPGMKEWELISEAERISVIQIPEDKLSTMCTYGLIETCFNYPRLSAVTNFEHFSTFLYIFVTHRSFNGVPELLSRCDAPKELLNKYLEFNEYPYADSIGATIKFKIEARLSFMELFLAHENIVTNLSNRELLLLGQKARDMFHLKHKYRNISFSISPTYSCYLLGRMMYCDGYEPLINEMEINNQLKNFILVGSNFWYYNESWEFIMNNIDSYFNSLSLSEN